MSKVPDLRQMFEPPSEILQAAKDGNLVLFVGAGASMLLGLPSWNQLAHKILEDLRANEILNYSDIESLSKLDARTILSIAHFLAEDNKYKLNIAQHLIAKSEGDSIYKAINDIGCSCITTNYDEMLAPRFKEASDGSIPPAPVRRISEKEKFFTKLLSEPGTVVHLHGTVSKPETIVLTTEDYLTHYDNENVKEFLGELFKKKTVLFIGYGLKEAEILEHILRKGDARQEPYRMRFLLQGFFENERELYEKLHTYYEKTFGVHMYGFLRDHENFICLEKLIKNWANIIEVSKPPLSDGYNLIKEVLDDQ